MSNESIQFMFGLEQCRASKGMYWYGQIPKEIVELYQLKIEELGHGYTIAGVYVTVKPQYEAFTPSWITNA